MVWGSSRRRGANDLLQLLLVPPAPPLVVVFLLLVMGRPHRPRSQNRIVRFGGLQRQMLRSARFLVVGLLFVVEVDLVLLVLLLPLLSQERLPLSLALPVVLHR